MDLNACLDILASRGSCKHESHDNDHECPIGQVIDVVPAEEEGPTCSEADQQMKQQDGGAALAGVGVENPQQSSVDKFREEMKGLEVKDLLKAFHRAQEDRVATYRLFDEGLEAALTSGDLGGYLSGVCTEATASFAALSNLVNAVEALLREPEKNQVAVARVIRQVQLQEKEKLSVTAALHLERVRLRDSGGGQDSVLLQQGVERLRRQLGEIRSSIVELLEELRFEAESLLCDSD